MTQDIKDSVKAYRDINNAINTAKKEAKFEEKTLHEMLFWHLFLYGFNSWNRPNRSSVPSQTAPISG